jgi:predicted RecB family nuclease
MEAQQEMLFAAALPSNVDDVSVGGYFTKGCAHYQVSNENPVLDSSLKDEDTPSVVQRKQDGIKFEANVFLDLAVKPGAVQIPDADDVAASQVAEVLASEGVAIDTKAYTKQYAARFKDLQKSAKLEQEAATIKAMDAGVPLVLGGRLPRCGRRVGKPDVLVRYGTAPQNNGKWAYVPVDVKHHRSLEGTAFSANTRRWPVSDFAAIRYEDASMEDIGAGTPQFRDALQLVHYVHMLRSLGYYPEDLGAVGGVIGRDRTAVVWHDLEEALYMHVNPLTGERKRCSAFEVEANELDFRLQAISRVRLIAEGHELEPLTNAEWKAECKECPWRTVCHDDLLERDHVTLLPGVTPARAAKLAEAGIAKRSEVARLDPRTAAVVASHETMNLVELLGKAASVDPDTPVEDLFRKSRTDSIAAKPALLKEMEIHTAGDLLALDRLTANVGYLGDFVRFIDSARAHWEGKVLLARGVGKLEVPRADVEVDVDMENDSVIDPDRDDDNGGLIYMWGTLTTSRHDGFKLPGKGYRAFTSFETNDKDGEGKAFAELWGWLQSLITLCRIEGLTFKAYCYSAAESRCMRSLAKDHAGKAGIPTLEEVEAFLVSEHWVDMYKIVCNQLVWPTEDLGLKSTAKWARHSWRDSEANGASSVVWYQQATRGETEKIRKDAADRLLAYNEDDVLATWRIREWLRGIRLPKAESLDARFRTMNTRLKKRK